MTTRRLLLAMSAAALLAGCGAPSTPGSAPMPAASAASAPVAAAQTFEPIVFVHGNGDSASIWQTVLWRFESNGWPANRLFAFDQAYPLARDADAVAQPGRSSTADHMAFVKTEVERILRATGEHQAIVIGSSRGGYAIRNYIQNGGGAKAVSRAILGGTPNHGVYAIKGYNEGSEFSGTGPFLTALNKPKDPAGDEVTGPVKWLTLRSDQYDKYAQPDGRFLGLPGKPTGVTYAGPELKGATNVVLPGVDHRGTAVSPAAFEAMWQFITGKPAVTRQIATQQAPRLAGRIFGLGLAPLDPRSGDYVDNLPVEGARIDIYPVNAATGERLGRPVYGMNVFKEGHWGPFAARAGVAYEFVVSAPGYATTHVYRSPFPRSSSVVNLQLQRIAPGDKDAQAIVTLARPRGYMDPTRDRVSLDGQSPPAGLVPGPASDKAKLKTSAQPRPVLAEFNGERVVGRPWPAANNEVTILELTY